jgi:CheY-like chemotaxis protein
MPSRERILQPTDARFWLASSARRGRSPARRILHPPDPGRLAETQAQAARVSRRVLENMGAPRPKRPLRALPPGPAARERRAPGRARWLRGRTVLIVEDHADSRDLLRMAVESCGATVQVAADGEEALARIAERRPDLVLCDLRMPNMDGFTLMQRLRADPKLRSIRVVAVTALGSDEDILRTWKAGFDGHLVKPVDLDLITSLLERVFWANPRPK